MAASVGIFLSYDSEADILELVTSPDQPYVSHEVRHGFLVHHEPKSGAIVRFAIHHFLQDFSARPLNLPLKVSFAPAEGAERDLALR